MTNKTANVDRSVARIVNVLRKHARAWSDDYSCPTRSREANRAAETAISILAYVEDRDAEIAAVRAQAASAQPQPPARDLVKVRDLIRYATLFAGGFVCDVEKLARISDAAEAELDAQPKAAEVPVEAIRYALSYLRSDTTKTNLLANIDTIDRWLAQVEGGVT